MQSYPLTRERFLIAAIARSGDNPFELVDNALIDYWCLWASVTVQSAMGDRVTPPLLEWDECLEGHAVMLAWRPIMGLRGYEHDQGRDSEVTEMAKMADAYLSRLRPGTDAPGKSENPMFVDSGGNKPRDSIFITAGTSSMDALLRGCRSRCS